MPELPEVAAMVDYLSAECAGRYVAGVEVAAISVLKTYDPPISALHGLSLTRVDRYGKFLDLDFDGLHLVIHLARAGWIRRREALSTTPLKPGKGPLALRVRFDDGSGLDVTEAGTRKRLAAYVVHDPQSVPGIARLGLDPMAPDFDAETFRALLAAHPRTQLKGLLRDQSVIAGVGNAYSDEILHVAGMSPFRLAGSLDEDQATRLHAALIGSLAGAIERSRGLPASGLKDDKRAAMRVHGRTGQPCPECGEAVREVSFADSTLQYCAGCQTGGKPLADRRLSRLLK